MASVMSDYGIIEYTPTWLEKHLEESLAREGIRLPRGKRLNLGDYFNEVKLARTIVGISAPFEAVFYSKTVYLERWKLDERKPPSIRTISKALQEPEHLWSETTRFVFSDGLVTLCHDRHPEVYSARWGGGDLEACLYLADVPAEEYISMRSSSGKEAVLFALDTAVEGITLKPTNP